MTRTSLNSVLIDFVWSPLDELMALKPPQRYGRVEIALADRIVDGIIERIVDTFPHPDDPEKTCYYLRISTTADVRGQDLSDIGVKVCS